MARIRHTVVGIGASAGGVAALQAFFKPMPAEPGMAFIVVMHLGEGHQSAMPEILARATALPIVTVQDGDPVEPNRVYVLSADALLTVHNGRLRLRQQTAGSRVRNTIDVLFASLADDIHDRSIGVILSGSGHDGTLGAKAIKEKGGLTVAQKSDHGTPQYPEMPMNAIASGTVDLQIPVEEMADRLCEYVERLDTLETRVRRDARNARIRVNRARQEICQILRDQIGHDFSGYKHRTFLRRVERRMQVLSLREIDDYVARLNDDRQEVIQLFRDLLIGVTAFFRDQEAFQSLAQEVIPALFRGRGASDTVRVWIPGCATGEEVYSLAILLLEHLDTLRARPKVACFATDIDERAIAVARTGRYPLTMLQNVSAARLDRFFTGDGVSYTLTKEVRDLCIFSSHSLIRDPPFSRLDLISCRNLLIYLDRDLQRQIIPVFHYALRPGGFLFLGLSEGLTEHTELFTVTDRLHRIFRRREDLTTRVHLPMIVPEPARRQVEPWPGSPNNVALPLRHIVDSRVIERFAPAHVVVTREGEVVHFSTRTGKYMESPAGAPTRNILAMARRGLQLDLRTTLAEVVATNRTAVRHGLRVEFDGRVQIVDLVAEPLGRHDEEALFLVVFIDVGPALAAEQMLPVVVEHQPGTSEQLEAELRETRERLQSVIEEYETALEELKSANEELVSINEEMQSTNEELETSRGETQSINEELNTVNSELHRKVEELDASNNNLRNLFEGTQIATVFLDPDLAIRNFTPATQSIFNLMDVDRGRPLTDIVSELRDLDLRTEVRPVLATGQSRERRVLRRDGTAQYLMRILPYRTVGGTIDGVLVTFTDITRIAEFEEYQRELVHRIETMLEIVTRIVERSLATGGGAEKTLDRLRALAGTYALLSRSNHGTLSLADLAANELESYGIARNGRVAVEGPTILLRPQAAISLGTALHELRTNAANHGALSVPGGRVGVRWHVERQGAVDARLVITWQETGGPEVDPGAIKGYGSELIEAGLLAEVGATAKLNFTRAGIAAELVLPLSGDLVQLPADVTPAEPEPRIRR